MIGGTKKAELDRSAACFKNILEDKGIYFALMFLIDSGYDANEIKLVAERFKDNPKRCQCEWDQKCVVCSPSFFKG